MKKKFLRMILVISLFFFGKTDVMAATVNGSIKVSTTSTVVGNSGTATLTISSNEPIGQIYGTFSCGGLGKKDLTYSASDSPSKSRSYTIKWTAKTAGTYTCEVTGLEVGTLETLDWPNVKVASKTIKVVKASSGSSNSSGNSSSSSKPNTGGSTSNKKEYSSDNTLKSLSVDGYEISPKFSKNVFEYKLIVDQSVEKIKVNAVSNDKKAKVSGVGEKKLSNGENVINVKVVAENGNEKIYKLIVTVSDLNPIKVNVLDEEFVVVKKNKDLIKPLDRYKETTIKISDQDVVAYLNEQTKVILVLLKNSNNEIGYYIYDKINNSYSRYRYIKIGNVTLQLLDNNGLDNYKRYDLELQDEKIDYFKIKKSHKVGLIYGTNVESGNTGYYVYDGNENTLSKYYNEEVKIYQKQIVDLKNYLMIFVGVVALVSIIVIISSLKKNKRKQKNRYKI